MLDLKRLEDKTLIRGIQEQCLSGARKTATEIQNMIKSHQSEVLFLLDGYEVNKNYKRQLARNRTASVIVSLYITSQY